jgi:hypothetical protein
MDHNTTVTMGSVILFVGLGLASSACSNRAEDCGLNAKMQRPDGTCVNGIGGSSSGSGTMSSTGGTGGSPDGCDPSKTSKPVADSCGVFVSPAGDDTNSGTKEKPLKSITAALTKSATIYACAGASPYTEAVTFDKAVTLYGALDCSKGWAYDASKKTVLTAAKDAIPLTLASAATGAEVVDFKVIAADAMVSGGSSIAVVADHATAMLTRCDLLAGNAKDGDPGVSGGTPAAQADPGLNGKDAGMLGSSLGGAGGDNMTCNLLGGAGGNGGPAPNGNGVDGNAGDSNLGGAKGNGDTGMGCSAGTQGNNGTAGPSGSVTPGIGTIDKSGYHGIDGQAGTDGTNGASGGGGGGSKAVNPEHGAGGGGGGAGGCAGKHGMGGKAAGSSIALVSFSASVTLTHCALGAGKAGDGGAGGDGQKGQPGGQQGNGGAASGPAAGCNGGTGGKGGNGGNGSGGLGGHSLGIAATGTAPVLDAATKKAIAPGTKGGGGKGGNMDADMNHGADGLAAACWDFGTNAACK